MLTYWKFSYLCILHKKLKSPFNICAYIMKVCIFYILHKSTHKVKISFQHLCLHPIWSWQNSMGGIAQLKWIIMNNNELLTNFYMNLNDQFGWLYKHIIKHYQLCSIINFIMYNWSCLHVCLYVGSTFAIDIAYGRKHTRVSQF